MIIESGAVRGEKARAALFGRQGRPGGGWQFFAPGRHGRDAPADRDLHPAGDGDRRHKAADPWRHHLWRGAFLYQPVRKGGLVFGGDIDAYKSYAQRGNLPIIEDVCEAGMALMPMIGRLRVLRQWAGNVDMTMDGSPIIDKTPVSELYFNGGWCYGGFKATPASGFAFAHLIARDAWHPAGRCIASGKFRHRPCGRRKRPGRPGNLH